MPWGYGRGFGRGFGRGRGRWWFGMGYGPGGYCVCPSCGYREPHVAGVPCVHKMCPNCNIPLIRQ